MAAGYSPTADAVRLMVEAAKARGWREIHITGGDENFRRQIWREAQRLGLPVANYAPPSPAAAPVTERPVAPARPKPRRYDALKSVPAAPAAPPAPSPPQPSLPQARPTWRTRLRFRARLLALFRSFARDLTARAAPRLPDAGFPQPQPHRPRRRFRPKF